MNSSKLVNTLPPIPFEEDMLLMGQKVFFLYLLCPWVGPLHKEQTGKLTTLDCLPPTAVGGSCFRLYCVALDQSEGRPALCDEPGWPVDMAAVDDRWLAGISCAVSVRGDGEMGTH